MATTTEKLFFETEFEADTSDVSKVENSLDDIADGLKNVENKTKRLADETKKVTQEQKQHKSATDNVKRSYLDLVRIDVSGWINSIVQGVGSAISASRNWALETEKIAAVTSTSLENATAFNVSLAKMGITGEEALGQLSSFQGRLIDDLEVQTEITKELANLDRERISILNDLEKAQDDHNQTIKELEAEISQVGQKAIAERLEKQTEAFADLEKERQEFTNNARLDEQRETERLSDIWKDRVRQYEKDVIMAMEDLTEQGAKARNFKEFQEIQRQGQKRIDQLAKNLNQEKGQFETNAEREAAARQQAVEEEKQALAEKSAFIEQQTAKDLAIIEERNAEQVANLQERIDEENGAWVEQQQSIMEGLADIDRQQVEVSKSTGSLGFIMKELNVDLFDSEGQMRDVVDVMFDMKTALDEMPESARKAALISDLGWEDLAVWIERGAGATESLQFAQENNLVPLTETLDKIHEQNKLLADLQLSLIGASEQYGLSTAAGDGFVWMLGKAANASQVLMDLLGQLQQIQQLVSDKVIEGINEFNDIEIGGIRIGDALIGLGEGVAGALGTDLTSLIGGGSDSLTPVGNTQRPTINLNVSGSIVGVEDVNSVVEQAINAYNGNALSGGL